MSGSPDGPPMEPVQAVPVEPATGDASGRSEGPGTETITEPAKLLRIASMVRELLEETRQATTDEGGRKRLVDIYRRSVEELADSVSPDLKEELQELAPPLDGDPRGTQDRVGPAPPDGGVEGSFHGV